MVNIDWLVKQFMTSKMVPEDACKNLLEGGFSEELVEQAYKEFLKATGNRRYLTPPPMLVEERQQKDEWYPGADSIPDARFWPALRSYLLHQKKWPAEAVNSIHEASDKIVAWLQSPWAARIDTRGLVVGYVQSGKTANFTAVIAKAADAGYRFFIVLSGTKKSLRSQTQQRLDRELISLNDDIWFSPTTQIYDFRPMGNNANFFLSDKKHDKVLCVVKKNTTVLRKLAEWLRTASPDVLRQCPFLIIDDEADEASPNTARNQASSTPEETERTAINRHLVNLLGLLPKAAYIGYTATPFANVLIDPRPNTDLYPGDFIVSLPKPDGHFGTEQIFGRARLLEDETDEEFEGIDMVRIIPQEEIPWLRPGRYDHDFVPEITSTLRDALHYFWLACAARMARGQNSEHSTMLIHTTQLIAVHNNTREQVESYRLELLRRILGAEREALYQAFEAQWREEQRRVPSSLMNQDPVSFAALRPYLVECIKRTLVVVDNSKSDFRLSYDEDPKIQIAIGGNTLSRGLTLEGLIVSFFVRAARAYDTLMQMGRWFGYRHEYEDLPRLWMTSELSSQFFDLATIEAEIRQDIENYAFGNVTPRQFGLRIRTHPDLNITARLKMQFAVEAQVSYDHRRVQTVLFNHQDYNWLYQNLAATVNLVQQLDVKGFQPKENQGHLVFYDVPVSFVRTYLNSYQFHPNDKVLSSNLLNDYIRDQNQYGLLEKWNIVIRGVTARDKSSRGMIGLAHLNVPLLERARRDTSSEHAHIGVLMSRGDIGADLPLSRDELKGESEDQLKERRRKLMPGTGLLIIYPISKNSEPGKGAQTKVKLNAVENVIGLGLVFPPAEGDSRGTQNYVTVDPSKLDRSGLEWVEEDEEEDEDA